MEMKFCDKEYWIRVLSRDCRSDDTKEWFGQIRETRDYGSILYLYRRSKARKKCGDFLMKPDRWIPLTIFDKAHNGTYRKGTSTYEVQDWVFTKEI